MADDVIRPRSFARANAAGTDDPYLSDPAAGKLADFFRAKGLAAVVEEDSREQWYTDWLDYQAKHRLYASVLSPKQFSTLGNHFDLLKLTRFLEVFGYFSPSHGYSLQVSFLGLFSILMGSNDALKREAVAALEAGGVFALGVSEKEHGSDLLGSAFTVMTNDRGTGGKNDPASLGFIANGSKYYIGNANCAAMVSILARRIRKSDAALEAQRLRAPFVLVAVRPGKAVGYGNVKKIRTSGVRAAFVGEFEVKDHHFPASDLIAEGRVAWDAVFGTVTLGKFFLGFASVGICAHAMEEAVAHLRRRVLYRKSVLEMPHIRLAMAQAYARLVAMKLYAYRALDYVQAASAADRRYLLFCAVQKSKVSIEGVKVMAQLSECIGAKGFESDMYFESALRNIQLIPGLEGSTHINLLKTAQFMGRYLRRKGTTDGEEIPHNAAIPKSLARGDIGSVENPYLMQAREGTIFNIAFAHSLDAYRPLSSMPNVRRFARQVETFGRLVRSREAEQHTESELNKVDDERVILAMGQCLATIAYAQLIAENALVFGVEAPMVSAMFHLLIGDLSAAAANLAGLPGVDKATLRQARRMIAIPMTTEAEWGDVAGRMSRLEGG